MSSGLKRFTGFFVFCFVGLAVAGTTGVGIYVANNNATTKNTTPVIMVNNYEKEKPTVQKEEFSALAIDIAIGKEGQNFIVIVRELGEEINEVKPKNVIKIGNITRFGYYLPYEMYTVIVARNDENGLRAGIVKREIKLTKGMVNTMRFLITEGGIYDK